MIIFVDANIWLDYFSDSDIKAIKFLEELAGEKHVLESIWVTQKIVDEVNKNKLRIVLERIAPIVVKSKVSAVALESDDEGKRLAKEANKALNVLRSQVDDAANAKLELVVRSEDAVSRALAPIFDRAHQPTNEQWERAKRRKETGNPPGKKEDSIGDQLSWEQLLDAYDGGDLVLVTKDSDFAYRLDKKLYLNPLLYQELKLRCRNGQEPNVSVVKDLSDAIEMIPEVDRPNIDADELKELKKIEGRWDIKDVIYAQAFQEELNQRMARILFPNTQDALDRISRAAEGISSVKMKEAIERISHAAQVPELPRMLPPLQIVPTTNDDIDEEDDDKEVDSEKDDSEE